MGSSTFFGPGTWPRLQETTKKFRSNMEIPQLFQQKPLKGSWKILKKGVHVMWYHCRCDVCVCVCLEHVQWIFRWSAKEPWQFYPVFSSHEILLGQLVSWVTIPKPGVSYPTNHLYISYQLYCSYISYITLYNCIIYIYIYIIYIYIYIHSCCGYYQ